MTVPATNFLEKCYYYNNDKKDNSNLKEFVKDHKINAK